jgi:hypothetical protein
MSLIGDLFDGVLEGTGWAAGVAVVVGVAVLGSRRGSPLVKEAMKGYLTVSDRVRELVAEAGEQLADLYAEAEAEYRGGASSLATVGAPVAAATGTAPRRQSRPRAAASEGAEATGEGSGTTRRTRRPRAEGAATNNNEGAAATTPRRGRRTRATTPEPGTE